MLPSSLFSHQHFKHGHEYLEITHKKLKYTKPAVELEADSQLLRQML